MRDFVLDAPFWQVALAITLVVASAALLYRIDRGNRHVPAFLRAALGLIRASLLATMVLLLFRPVLRSERIESKQPALLVLQDVSESIGQDHPGWKDTLDAWLAALPSKAGEPGAEVAVYSFGADLQRWKETGALSAPITDLSGPLRLIRGEWAGRPIGQVVLATDGRFNRGRDPEAEGLNLGAPVQIIALGDTSLRKDVRIDRLLHNDVAGLGNQFPIEAEVSGQGISGPIEVSLSGGGTRKVETVNLEAGVSSATVTFLVEATEAGVQRYTVSVSEREGEVNTANNRRRATIEVIERKKRLLLVAPAPHPDRGAWANALSDNANYEVLQPTLASLQGEALAEQKADGLLLFGFDPGRSDALELFQRAQSLQMPVGLFVDPDANFNALSSLGLGFSFQPVGNGLHTDPKGSVNPAFPHFAVGEALEKLLLEVPPLVSPFGEADWGPAFSPLLYQRIGGIITDDPLLTVAQTDKGRIMVLLGEGSWRWRQVGFLRTGSHEAFDGMVSQLAQYLTSNPGVDRFRVDGPRLLDEDQRLQFQARVYDATLQPLAGADIALALTDSSGTRFDYQFSSTPGTGYGLDAGRLPKGTYGWTASTQLGDTEYVKSGTVDIVGIELEKNGLPADHNRLRRLAESTGGLLFQPDELETLTSSLLSSSRFVPQQQFSEQLQDLIHWKALLYILLGLMSIEWFVRRWVGTY